MEVRKTIDTQLIKRIAQLIIQSSTQARSNIQSRDRFVMQLIAARQNSNISSKGSVLPQKPQNPVKAIEEQRNKYRIPQEILEKLNEWHAKASKFIKDNSDFLRRQYPDRWGNATDEKIKEELFSSDKPLSITLPADQQKRYKEIIEEGIPLDNAAKKYLLEGARHYPELYNFYKKLKESGEYKKFLDEHRLDPNSASDPHPSNVRVLGATSQHKSADGKRPNEKADPFDVIMNKALEETNNMDDMIKKVTEEVIVREHDPNNYRFSPDIQKAVSTPNRENQDAWKKSDNTDPNIKRVAIFIAAGDEFLDTTEELKKHYVEKSANDFDSTSNSKKYRVDKIIFVKPLTREERAKGITMGNKIKAAYKEAENFVKQEKEKAGEKANELKFEGIAHWGGHGAYDEKAGPTKGTDKDYLEGSREFEFVADDFTNELLNEATIKRLEREHLGNFRYFIQTFNSCHSGAAIS